MKLFFGLVACIIFLQTTAFAIGRVDHPPEEVLVLKILDGTYANWKEISRWMNAREGWVECIPYNQSKNDWSDLIAIQYIAKNALRMTVTQNIEEAVNAIKKEYLSSYPGCKVTWNILEKNRDDILYEWIVHDSYCDVPPQHEIARAFLTEQGFHRIAFTKQYKQMEIKEKEDWIKKFQNNVFITSLQSAEKEMNSLSLVDKSNTF